MNQIKLEDLDFLYVYNNNSLDGENNRINFQKVFQSQKELLDFMTELKKCNGDMKIFLRNGIILRVYIVKDFTKQDGENLLKINFYGFILKHATW